ncbi:MAG: L-2,4-diaminobutyrate decarboxylase [Deltaproteobacteria bacterium]|nr:L-2,4-diaminobutyrate decarboxylase [Deltaproteobacteria bacterium]
MAMAVVSPKNSSSDASDLSAHAERSLLDQTFDPEAFRALGHRWVDALAEYLASARDRKIPVLPWQAPRDMLAEWPAEFPARDGGDPDTLLARVIATSNHLHHPRYFGHQCATTLPLAALCELLGGILNNGSIYEMGPGAMAMERAVSGWLTRQLGFGAGAEAIFTSGGSLGNLTGLLAAQASRAGHVWKDGQHAGPPLAVLVSSHAHYSISRAVCILGWGEGGAVDVPVDTAFRMRPDELEPALARARQAGRRVIAVVATAGSVPTGAYDPLPAIADFCAKHELWLHVDGAHGAAAALSPHHRHLVDGIERADSVVWDAHKMLLMPSLLTAVVFRDSASSYDSFAQDAQYLLNSPTPWADSCQRTFECTKDTMVLKLYVALAHFGPALFSEYVHRMFSLAATFAKLIAESPDFELAVPPACNIVMFRYVPPGATDLDELQAWIRERLRNDGSFYLVRASLDSHLYLRTCMMNPLSTENDLRALMDAVRRAVADRPGR